MYECELKSKKTVKVLFNIGRTKVRITHQTVVIATYYIVPVFINLTSVNVGTLYFIIFRHLLLLYQGLMMIIYACVVYMKQWIRFNKFLKAIDVCPF